MQEFKVTFSVHGDGEEISKEDIEKHMENLKRELSLSGLKVRKSSIKDQPFHKTKIRAKAKKAMNWRGKYGWHWLIEGSGLAVNNRYNLAHFCGELGGAYHIKKNKKKGGPTECVNCSTKFPSYKKLETMIKLKEFQDRLIGKTKS